MTIMFLLFFVACEEQCTTPQDQPNNGTCCKVCTNGKPCGDTCISNSYECHVCSGCACNSSYATLNSIPYIQTNNMFNIAGLEYQSGVEHGFIDQNGYFNYESGKELVVKFIGSNILELNSSNNYNIVNLLQNNNRVNILRLMLTLDIDNYLYNGISIESDISENIIINFNLSVQDFAIDENVLFIVQKYGRTNKLVPISEVDDFIYFMRNQEI